MYLSFKIDGQIQLSRNLQKISAAVTDFTPAFEQSGEDLTRFFSYDVFESEGDAIDESWAPLSKAYAYRKAKLYPGRGILEATGKMRSSFLYQADSTSLRIWNSAEYFKYHQSILPRTKMPRRAMMKLTENLRETVVKNFQVQFLEAVNA